LAFEIKKDSPSLAKAWLSSDKHQLNIAGNAADFMFIVAWAFIKSKR
jgi:hypothetical protein